MSLREEHSPMWWTPQAACKEEDPELFFPKKPDVGEVAVTNAKAAKEICATCPVLMECREYALDNPAMQGVWGGMTHPERLRARAERREAAGYFKVSQ